jgi:hypothetical protein
LDPGLFYGREGFAIAVGDSPDGSVPNAKRALFSDIPSSGIFRVVGGDLALSLRFIEESSEY